MANSAILQPDGTPFFKANGHARPQLLDYYTRSAAPKTQAVRAAAQSRREANLSYDAAGDGDESRRYFTKTDSLDADSANSLAVRKRLRERSRYEDESNGQYAGIIKTHCDMLVGVGPKLRMLTDDRDFNQRVETAFSAWSERVQLRRKLWSMAHAKVQDGEAFWILQNDDDAPADQVQLDILPIETDQCHTPFPPAMERGYLDGIRTDPRTGKVLWYDILPEHPGGRWLFSSLEPTRVDPSQVLHWFTLKRPGTHRGVPDLSSTLNCGAAFRRWREATIKKAEVQSAFTVFLETGFQPEVMDPVSPMDSLDIEKGMMSTLPMGQRAKQLENNTPGAQYPDFYRSLVSEQARPLSMPFNAAACDSSTYSFASGKLDTLCYRAALDVERSDADLLVLDRVFAAFYREWAMLNDRRRGLAIPLHQWDWPAHPVIDDQGDAKAKETRLLTGQTSFRQVYSEAGRDYEDQLGVMAQDWFGDGNPESIQKARTINLLRTVPKEALPYVAALIGLPPVKTGATADAA